MQGSLKIRLRVAVVLDNLRKGKGRIFTPDREMLNINASNIRKDFNRLVRFSQTTGCSGCDEVWERYEAADDHLTSHHDGTNLTHFWYTTHFNIKNNIKFTHGFPYIMSVLYFSAILELALSKLTYKPILHKLHLHLDRNTIWKNFLMYVTLNHHL